MVDRISKPVVTSSTSTVKKVSKSAPVAQETTADKSKPDNLVERVMSKVQKEPIQSEAKLRRQMIFHTLTDMFGEKAAREPKFIALVDKIDKTLENSPVTSEQLREILKKSVKA